MVSSSLPKLQRNQIALGAELRVFDIRLGAVSSNVVSYEWHVTEFQAAYDGFTRSVYGINGEAGHSTAIEITLGDTVQVLVVNELTTTTGIHWHGMLQVGTPDMDGASGTTQCGILPGKSVTYRFTPERAGTFMWHGHDGSQTMDNLRGPLIVRPASSSTVDAEYTVQLADWYHTKSDEMMKAMMMDTSGDEPVWNSVLVNGMGQVNCSALDASSAPCSSNQSYTEFQFLPSKTYQLRLINIGSYAAFEFSIDGHEFSVVEVDGEDVEPSKMLTSLVINVAQRYSILMATKSTSELAQGDTRFWMRATAQIGLPWTTLPYFKFPGGFNPNGFGIVSYTSGATGDPATTPATTKVTIDELDFVPSQKTQLPDTPSQRVIAQFQMKSMASGGTTMHGMDMTGGMGSSGMVVGSFSIDNKAFTSYKIPQVPTLLAIASGTKVSKLPVESNVIQLEFGKHVEIVLVNLNSIEHPFHTHGYRPWVVAKGNMASATSKPSALNLQDPIVRDVFTVPPCTTDLSAKCIDVGYVVLRLNASNAGAWIFHCHIDWHMAMGLTATLVTGASELKAKGLGGLSSDIVRTCPSISSGSCSLGEWWPVSVAVTVSVLFAYAF